MALAACLLLRPVPVADTEVEAEAGSAEAEDGAAAGLKQARLEPNTNTLGHSSYCSHGSYYLHIFFTPKLDTDFTIIIQVL